MNNHDNTFYSIVENLPAFVSLQKSDYTMDFANRSFRERFGEIQSRTCYEIFLGAGKPCESCTTSAVFTTGEPRESEWSGRDNRTYRFQYHPFPVSGGGRVLKFGIDVTDRKKKEEESLRYRNLETVAVLAGGIAHDFNNLLTSILGNLSLAKEICSSDNRLYTILNDAERASVAARDLVYKLNLSAGLERPEMRATKLESLFEDIRKVEEANPGVKITCKLPDGLPEVEVDVEQIRTVIGCIIANACQALPDGGEIAVTCSNFIKKQEDALLLKDGEYVMITFSEEGEGIGPENLHRVFDPYFTTRKRGVPKGAGLGLTICHAIIKNHGGHIAVDSASGKGTTFSLYLPSPRMKGWGK